MIAPSTHTMLWYLHELIHDEQTHEDTDRDLVRRFVAFGDQAAFTALMRRHSRLVWSVCRRSLNHEQDAEDAFQATFLVLAKKAGSIRSTESVGSWLYGVAQRIAVKARSLAVKRRERERVVASSPIDTATVGDGELYTILDEEVRHLPDKYRLPFVLCCLEGKRRRDAARELGWKEGTLSTRVATAKRMLQERLTRRGYSLVACLGATLSAQASATVPAALERTTLETLWANATADPVGLTPQPVVLATGVLNSMLFTKSKPIIVACLLLVVFAAGVVVMAHQGPANPSNARGATASPLREPPEEPKKNAERGDVEKAVREILDEFDKADAKWKARIPALAKLVRVGADATPVLVDALKDPSAEKRALVVEALTMFGDPRAKPAFRRMLNDLSPPVRINAIRGLSLLGRLDPTEEPYRTMLTKDPNYRVREALAWAFERDDAKTAPAAVRKRLVSYDVSAIDTARLDRAAPDFELTDIFGKTYQLSDFRGKKSVVLKFYNEPL